MSPATHSNLLESLVFLYEAYEVLDDPSTPSPRLRRRQYVRQEHVRFLRSRLRLFDEYLVTRRPEAFLDFIRLLPNEFENLYQRIGSRLEHFTTHAGPISGRHRLMVYLRYVTQGITFKAYALDIGIGISTVAAIVREVTEAIIIGTEFASRTTRNALIQRCILPTLQFYHPLGFVDCDHRIIAYDVGAPGRAGDAGVLRDSALKCTSNNRTDIWLVGLEVPSLDVPHYLDFVQTQRLVISLMILHNLLPQRQDFLEAVQRFEPAPNAAYHPLETEEPEPGTESSNRARERLTQYYIDKDGPARF